MRARLIAFCCYISGFGFVSPAPAADPVSPASQLQRFAYESRHMGTTFRIVLYSPNREKAEGAAKSAFQRIGELDRVMSDYNPESELMRLCSANDADPGKPREVSADLLMILQASQDLAKKTDGAFDVTVGPLSQIWRLVRRTQQLPDAKELANAKAAVGWEKLVLDPETSTVTLKTSGMRLDLGGIAKGYAVDQAVKMLRSRKLDRFLIAAAGDIYAGKAPPGGDGWAVEIAPLEEGKPPRKVQLANAAISTSGDLFQSVEIAGVQYSHVLDPKTGLGLTGFRSVTVIAPTATQSDAYSTAASLLPPKPALKLVESIPGAMLYMVVKTDANAEPVVTKSAEFPE